jgi:hypothetical protein
MSTWQPIETAPKDESDIIVCRSGKEVIATFNIVYWNDTDLGSRTHPWCFVDGGGAYHRDWPTHWMPLPPPPAVA